MRRLGLFAFCILLFALALAIALLPLELAAIVVVGAIAAALAVLDPVWALYLAVLSVPVQEVFLLPGGLTVTQAALLLAAASLALHVLAHPERPIVWGRLFVPLALFVWTLGLATAFTPYSFSEAVRETARWSTVPLIYLLALRAIPCLRQDGMVSPPAPTPPQPPRHSWRLWGLVVCLLLAPAANAIVGLVQFWYGLGPEAFGIGDGRVRAYGTIGQPNSFAGAMNQGWPLAAGVAVFALVGLLTGARRRPVLIAIGGAGLATGLMGAALLASFSRGGWVGGVAGAGALTLATLVMLPERLRRQARRVLLAGGAALVAVTLLGGGGLLPDTIERRVSSLVGNLRLFDARGVDVTPANFAIVERMAHLQAGWHMFTRHPLTGVGPGNYSFVYEQPPVAGERPISIRPWYESRGHAHNYYLHIAAETGLLGLSAYLVLIGAVVWQAIRAVRFARGWFAQGLAAGGAGVVAAVAAHNLFENLHVLNLGLQLGSIWALLVIIEASGLTQGP